MTAALPGKRTSRNTAYQHALAGTLIAALAAAPAYAVDGDAPSEPSASPPLHEYFYKGVIGTALEAVPLEPDDRVQLQRGSSVVTNTLTGRSLNLLLGLVSPVLTVGGFMWGLWSAANIRSPAGVPAAPVSDAVLIPTKSRSVIDVSHESMEDALRAIIMLGSE